MGCMAFASLRGDDCYLSRIGSCWYAQGKVRSMLAKDRGWRATYD